MKTSHFGKLQRIRERPGLALLSGDLRAANSIPA